MGLFSRQFADVIEWQEYRDDILFYRWNNGEIKKGSKLIIKPGQDAIFLFNGKIEGVFHDEGSYDIESQIVPFLSTLSGFQFGFNSGMRAEVLFINTKEVLIKWGTKAPINIPTPNLPGGLPVRAFGTFTCKVGDYGTLIDKVAGIKTIYTVDDIKERVVALLDQLLMRWIVKEGKDMYNLQANSFDISRGICEDLDMEMRKIGMAVSGFHIASFTYPEEIQQMINKVASQGMVGDMGKYTTVGTVDAMGKGGHSAAADMAGLAVGVEMGKEVIKNMQETPKSETPAAEKGTGEYPKFCPNCGTKTTGSKFCAECGKKLQ